MQDTSKVILSSDFESLKNDARITGSITVPASIVIPGSGSRTFVQDVSVSNTPIDNTSFKLSADSIWTVLAIQTSSITQTGSPGGYSAFVSAYYINSTTMRYEVFISNPYNVPLTTGPSITVQFRSAMFTDPFI